MTTKKWGNVSTEGLLIKSVVQNNHGYIHELVQTFPFSCFTTCLILHLMTTFGCQGVCEFY